MRKKFILIALVLITILESFSCQKDSTQPSSSSNPVPTTTSTSTNTGQSPPNISYVYPEYFTVGKAVVITPTNSGTAVPATVYSHGSTFYSGFASMMTFDQSGNLYITDAGIKKITPAGLVSTIVNTFGTPNYGSSPIGIVIDQLGNFYVCNSLPNIIQKITPGGIVSNFAGSYPASGKADGTGSTATFNSPQGITIDQTGNLYVTDAGNNLIRKITSAGLVSTFASGLSVPFGITIDPSGNFFVSEIDGNLINKITLGGLVSIFAGSGLLFKDPYGIVFDQSGNLYVADGRNYDIKKITPGGLVSIFYTDGNYTLPVGIAIDQSGNLYVAFEDIIAGTNNYISKIITTGYSISPSLPAGLIFDAKTGSISGIPTVTSPSTSYTISAFTVTGASSTTTIELLVQ